MSAKKKTLNDEILALSSKIRDSVTTDSIGTVKETNPGEVYEKNLPTGITMDTVKDLGDYNSSFIAAGCYAIGEIAIEAMTKDSKIDQVTGDIRMGVKDSAEYTVSRVKNHVDQFHGGKEIEKYGHVAVSYEVKAGKNSGQLKLARQQLSEMALAAFKK